MGDSSAWNWQQWMGMGAQLNFPAFTLGLSGDHIMPQENLWVQQVTLKEYGFWGSQGF